MKVSDFIVEFFNNKGIEHFFGYQGTMIAHLVDSICNNKNVKNHVCYNEQGAAFAAVGFAKATGKPAVAYATSGPGAVNLLSGVADAYYDSAPVIFITGQLNTYEYTGIENIRQNGFQEIDIISMASPIVKYCVQITEKSEINEVLEKAYYIAQSGRPGPVLIDLPMNIQREDIDDIKSNYIVLGDKHSEKNRINEVANDIIQELNSAKAPVLLIGNGIVKGSVANDLICSIARDARIPIITSMLGRHLLEYDNEVNFGYLGGGYGHRYANLIIYKKTDLIVSFGCSLCKRQTAMNTEKFAEKAKIIRIDIDSNELKRKVHRDEKAYNFDCNEIIKDLWDKRHRIETHDKWIEKCKIIKEKLENFDLTCEERRPNKYLEVISEYANEDTNVCCDVGQHQVWVAQSFKLKARQTLLFSGGHGAMGFALPAAIGAYYGNGNRTLVICGDGAIQMNIQELQWIVTENIPVTIIILNNHSLGLIQQQQDDIFQGRYYASVDKGGYSTPDFQRIGQAYGIISYKVQNIENLKNILKTIDKRKPALIEVILETNSRAYPKTFFGEEMYNQRPYVSEELMKHLLNL